MADARHLLMRVMARHVLAAGEEPLTADGILVLAGLASDEFRRTHTASASAQDVQTFLRQSAILGDIQKHAPYAWGEFHQAFNRAIRESSRTRLAKAQAKFKGKKEVPKADGSGTTVVYEYSDQQVSKRHSDKAKRIEKLRKSMGDLRRKITGDLDNKDPNVRLTALAVALMDETYERVGNDGSAKEGHFGVTGWKVKHITFSQGKATMKYVGKSGVKQEKVVTNSKALKVLKAATKGKTGDEEILCEGDDCRITASHVNDYLKPFHITAKDLRGLHANEEMRSRLKGVRSKGGKLPSDDKAKKEKLKAEWDKALEGAASAVGHEAATLKSQYLVPGLEDEYLKHGTVPATLDKSGSTKTAIISLNNATDGDEDGDMELRGFMGLISSLTLFEQAVVQDMDIHDKPIIGSKGSYTLRGRKVQDDVVGELVGSGYLEETPKGVVLSPLFAAKRKLYTASTALAGQWGEVMAASAVTFKTTVTSTHVVVHLEGPEFVNGFGNRVQRNLGSLTTYWEDSPKRLRPCADEISSLRAQYPQLHERVLLVNVVRIVDEDYLGKGLGNALYEQAMKAAFQAVGPFLFAPSKCGMDGETSGPAQRVWGSIARRYPSEGGVVAVLRTPKVATKTHKEREDEEVERLVRPSPKKKPPRKDLRRERVDTETDTDPDSEQDKKDQSQNFKDIGASVGGLVTRVAYLHLMAAKPSRRQRKKQKKEQANPKPAESGSVPEWSVGKTYTNPDSQGDQKVEFGSLPLKEQEKLRAQHDGPGAEDEGGGDKPKGEAEEDPKAKAQAEEKAKADAAAKAKEQEAEALKKDLGTVDAVIEDIGGAAQKAQRKFDDKQEEEMATAYADAIDALIETPPTGKAMAEMAGMAEAVPGPGVINNPKKLGEFLAKQRYAKKVLTNPMMIGGRALSEDNKGTGGTVTPEQLDHSRERGEQAYSQFSAASEPQRRDAFFTLYAEYQNAEPGSPRHTEVRGLMNGVALSIAMAGEPVPYMAHVPESYGALGNHLKAKGDGSELKLLNTVTSMSSGESRETISSIMEDMDDEELSKVVGGSDGHYGDWLEAIMSAGSLYEDAGKKPAVAQSELRDALRKRMLDTITFVDPFIGEVLKSQGKEVSNEAVAELRVDTNPNFAEALGSDDTPAAFAADRNEQMMEQGEKLEQMVDEEKLSGRGHGMMSMWQYMLSQGNAFLLDEGGVTGPRAIELGLASDPQFRGMI
ncbi:hypothetical protein N9917_01010 [Deltaproteobacteria bacterium]|nr:hypothetical protein [Deltaproteobacteria bacterium]